MPWPRMGEARDADQERADGQLATYIVNVPQRIPPAVRERIPRTCEAFAADLRLYLHRGKGSDLTVQTLILSGARSTGSRW
ncbi:hypothetical protein GCM10010289_79040 [Streptomyces violascens]|uniref:Uncharacterized protein n=1 Tax=Streptomyces violascens TaxID=67381 RepID=A0ABQ3QEY9_9ACTN|nr:hypothetical protein GCM10010289_79040 [Streptomyces violascens]GHI35822.1 hypothetical protein Sviol_02300 [Streptomyces violascens]